MFEKILSGEIFLDNSMSKNYNINMETITVGELEKNLSKVKKK